MSGLLIGYLLTSAGILTLVWHHQRSGQAPVTGRFAATRSDPSLIGVQPLPHLTDTNLPPRVVTQLARYRLQLRLAADGKTLNRFLLDKVIAAFALPLILAAPYLALTHQTPSLLLLLLLAAVGFWIPDISLRQAVKRRRERVFLALPDALSIMALALGAGQSLRQALELAARDCRGPLGIDIAAALTRARRDPTLDERRALVQVAEESGEPSFGRFAELLATKESPYLDFLRTNAAQARSEQNRMLEQAADRAYLAMHAPLAPLLTTLILVVAYGFLHLLSNSI